MFLAILAGVLIGVLLGALGGGGSILAVPALVYGFGQSAQEAGAGSLVIVGTTSLVAALGRTRAGDVDWRRGLVFGIVGVVGAVAGARLSANVDPEILLFAFGALLLVVAVLMWRRASRPRRTDEPASATEPGRPHVHPARVLVTATAVGLLTGFFGVGGGFAIVPALVLALEMPMTLAVGTSLVVIAVNCVSALAARAGTGIVIDWSIVAPFTLSAVVASLVAARLARRLPQHQLTRAFAVLLVLVGGYMAVRSGSALTN